MVGERRIRCIGVDRQWGGGGLLICDGLDGQVMRVLVRGISGRWGWARGGRGDQRGGDESWGAVGMGRGGLGGGRPGSLGAELLGWRTQSSRCGERAMGRGLVTRSPIDGQGSAGCGNSGWGLD